VSRHDPLLPNAWIVAKREYVERVRSRLFVISTLVLVLLAVLVAFAPIFVRAIDSGTTTRVAVVASDPALAERSIAIMEGVLNAQSGVGNTGGGAKPYSFIPSASVAQALDDVTAGVVDAALVAQRSIDGAIDFTFYTGEGIGPDRAQLVGVGTLAVAILDWTSSNSVVGREFAVPTLDVIAAGGPSAGGAPISNAEFTGRRVVGIVFVVLIFLLLVVYGMWVAAGVVAEKTSRVMELIVAAASPRQLLVGKVLGIGAAGFTQYACVLTPALIALALQDQIASALFGATDAIAPSLAALTPGLIGAYALFFVLGFVLYGCIYAAAGSLVSRPEDLQTISLPLSLIAVAGYMVALLSLSGGLPSVTRVASFIPFWSPFVMTTRLTVGRVEPWELALSFAILIGTIAVALVLATRVYAAGVLLYGQRPGLMAVVRAVRHPV
jgi:ABC-2 type transport system permease protein